jgi:hypothetical protein
MGHAMVLAERVEPYFHPEMRHVCVRDVEGESNWFYTPQGCIEEYGGRQYVGVGTIHATTDGKLFLIEFPVEADNGKHRIWIRKSTILRTNGVGFVVPYPKNLEHLRVEAPEYVI